MTEFTPWRIGRRSGISAMMDQKVLGDRAMAIATGHATLAGDQALAIAQADAARAYGDLSPYCIRLALEPDGWHVDYELKDPRLKGGGPHYVIDSTTATITSRRYEQ
jgi:hypothetical protein